MLRLVEWKIRTHPDFYKDLEKLGTKELEIFYKKKEKIKSNPERLKHLHGGSNCYREPINDNIRLVYMIEGEEIWLLAIGRHDKTYDSYRQRLYSIRESVAEYGMVKETNL